MSIGRARATAASSTQARGSASHDADGALTGRRFHESSSGSSTPDKRKYPARQPTTPRPWSKDDPRR
jgi:hypothetical protein